MSALIAEAAKKHGVPEKVLNAVCTWESQTYSAGQRQPWPWTLNVAGAPAYYRSYYGAALGLNRAISKGISNIDIGMCQINWYWHQGKFNRAVDLLVPKVNVEYASAYLSELKRKGKSWKDAIGRYHSPGCVSCAREYSRRVLQLRN
ncbi:lytic transglycosylase domain-containing protein [Haliea sp.]|uniref:lytic transglycosylase domain-containing protein n=1 Tax=Haliea sp. TaxID=1932666 RepID=UPI00257FACB1|nr:lytic transglycosylase domain-containing protein [Haliea sp.]